MSSVIGNIVFGFAVVVLLLFLPVILKKCGAFLDYVRTSLIANTKIKKVLKKIDEQVLTMSTSVFFFLCFGLAVVSLLLLAIFLLVLYFLGVATSTALGITFVVDIIGTALQIILMVLIFFLIIAQVVEWHG